MTRSAARPTRLRRPAGLPDHAVGLLKDVPVFGANPGALRMRLYAPPGLSPRAPLVVALHGCTQTGAAYAAGAGWLTLADRYGFAVLCPEQTRANNPNLCFNWFEAADAARAGGEAASIAAMVEHAVTTHDLDPDRVFVTGLSAGGAMTAVMLATWPELFAAGAVIAGLPYGSATTVAEAFAAMSQARTETASSAGDRVRAASSHRGDWPTMSIWHGQNDAVVRPAAGEALARQWTNLHGADDEPVVARTPAGRDFLVWMAAGRPVVELHRIPGMGHGVPLRTDGVDGSGAAGAHMFEVGISSSLEIALGWGIAEQRLDLGRAASEAEARQTPDPAHRVPDPAPAGPPAWVFQPGEANPYGVGQVIESALRAAGLMR